MVLPFTTQNPETSSASFSLSLSLSFCPLSVSIKASTRLLSSAPPHPPRIAPPSGTRRRHPSTPLPPLGFAGCSRGTTLLSPQRAIPGAPKGLLTSADCSLIEPTWKFFWRCWAPATKDVGAA
ncbi:hypothetical protein Taro_025311 [Colocasia esculenta]|uniref:Uncharacterized protein n=1 Tax=Colocasia esculenta TaxID=4460 RepID=A0A843VBW1_COLES|nr:hypothetical protein [Colocasia esculenta]